MIIWKISLIRTEYRLKYWRYISYRISEMVQSPNLYCPSPNLALYGCMLSDPEVHPDLAVWPWGGVQSIISAAAKHRQPGSGEVCHSQPSISDVYTSRQVSKVNLNYWYLKVLQYSCTLEPYWVLVDNMELYWIWDVLAHKWGSVKIIILLQNNYNISNL